MIKTSECSVILIIAIVFTALNFGCDQRTVAPELQYDQAQVDALDSEIKKLEWD